MMALRHSFPGVFGLLALLIVNLARCILSEPGPYQHTGDQNVIGPPPLADASSPQHAPTCTATNANLLHDLQDALAVMQDHYFALWLGTWTTAIDWTAAVMGTYMSATLSSLSSSVDSLVAENEINKYFSHIVSYYFGQDHFAIRMQAFDDILWVVLGWLESTQFIESHAGTHYTAKTANGTQQPDGWHATQFIPAFAHRARVFYELAERGWDWRLCGGGMTWNPRLLPYKNAITNQLFIAASISMYLHFPGDENCSPFLSQKDASRRGAEELNEGCEGARRRYDPVYLANAINGYEWLKNSGMLNDQGLYVDGFHIQGYRWNHSKTTCDERNEMLYTYNQGVILSGLRGLWEATGNITYLEDGHELVRNVIRATGWTSTVFRKKQSHGKRSDEGTAKGKTALPSGWSGLGSNGILTELCDPSGRCNQNGQTFKGIFFHHLTTFCTHLPTRAARPGKMHAATPETAALHARSCDEYMQWVIHNAQAALRTRDGKGRFGAWWGAPVGSMDRPAGVAKPKRPTGPWEPLLPPGGLDYRNMPIEDYTPRGRTTADAWPTAYASAPDPAPRTTGDIHDRGRGRTVETQGSGLAVVRAMWAFRKRTESHGS